MGVRLVIPSQGGGDFVQLRLRKGQQVSLSPIRAPPAEAVSSDTGKTDIALRVASRDDIDAAIERRVIEATGTPP